MDDVNGMDVVTLGMLIIDEIHFQDGRPSATDILGGAGSWAVIGARVFRTLPLSARIGWTVHRGSDFPPKVENEITSWKAGCNFIDTPYRLTTRGWNGYGSREHRAFKYTTEKFRIDQTQLTPSMLRSRCFHLICTPTRCVDLVKGILNKRAEQGCREDDRPLFVWEPVPDSCGPAELANLMVALKYVDVVSPNHQELAALLRTDGSDPSDVRPDQDVTASSMKLCEGFPAGKGAVVVRCGERGCYVLSRDFSGYLPAYHQPNGSSQQSVVDPTGAGNAFLGGFCIGFLDSVNGQNPYRTGAIYGSIAAGCAVEQIGLPVLTTQGNQELWNGVSLKDRCDAYNRLLAKNGLEPIEILEGI